MAFSQRSGRPCMPFAGVLVSLLLLLLAADPARFVVDAATLNSDLIGVYEKVDGIKFMNTEDCPSTLRTSSFVFDQYVDEDFPGFGFFNIKIPHRSTKIGSSECKSTGSIYVVESDHPTVKNKSSIIEDWATAHGSKFRSYMAHEEFVQIASQERFLYGYDFVERNCGDNSMRAGAVFLWIEPSFNVHIHKTFEIEKGNKYLLITFKNWAGNRGCLYQASEVGGASDDYPAGPTADPSRKKGFKPRKTSRDPEASPSADGSEDTAEEEEDTGDGKSGSVFSGSEGKSSKKDKSCFPPHATVRLSDGTALRMDQLRIGHSVHVAPAHLNTHPTSSDVFLFTHRDPHPKSLFLKLATNTGRDLTVTPGHYIYINGLLAAAHSARVGDTLTMADGSIAHINRISKVVHRGLYNPQTIHGDIIVDGFVVSTYTTALEPALASVLLAPARALYNARLGSLLAGILDSGAGTLAHWMPAGPALV